MFFFLPLEVNLHTYLTTWLSSCPVGIFPRSHLIFAKIQIINKVSPLKWKSKINSHHIMTTIDYGFLDNHRLYLCLPYRLRLLGHNYSLCAFFISHSRSFRLLRFLLRCYHRCLLYDLFLLSLLSFLVMCLLYYFLCFFFIFFVFSDEFFLIFIF